MSFAATRSETFKRIPRALKEKRWGDCFKTEKIVLEKLTFLNECHGMCLTMKVARLDKCFKILAIASIDKLPTCSKGEEKKIRLFGVEFNPRKHSCGSRNEEEEEIETRGVEDKKYRCQFCCKEFPNSQALGGHQNAHKKERMKRKRQELHARRAGISFYLQPLIKSHGSEFDFSMSWFHDPRGKPFEEHNGSFKTLDQSLFAGGLFTARPPPLVPCIAMDHSISTLGIMHQEDRPVAVVKSSSSLMAKQSYQDSDLQLGLAMKPNLCNTSCR
ncbi:unnamed protein product [Musa hybrid cultivar]